MSCNGLQAITLDVKHEWWDCSVRAQPMLPKIWLIRDLVKAMIANHHVLNHGPIIPLRLLHTHHLNQNRTLKVKQRLLKSPLITHLVKIMCLYQLSQSFQKAAVWRKTRKLINIKISLKMQDLLKVLMSLDSLLQKKP